MKRISSVILLIAIILSVLGGCASKDVKTSVEFISMDTDCKFVAYNAEASDYEAKLKEELDKVNNFFGSKQGNIYMSYDGRKLKLSKEHYEVIKKGLEVNKFTDGAFELFIAPITKLWNINNATTPPSDTEVFGNLGYVGTKNVVFDDKTNTISFSGISGIDISGIAKGYAAAHIAEVLKKEGCESGVLSLGGNICCWGSKKDGEKFRIAINSPLKASGYSDTLGYIDCTDVSVVTAGTYERFFESEGVRYHHIIDPKTGYPAKTDVLSATVISEDGAFADALSTAIVVLGYENCSYYISKAVNEGKIQGAIVVNNNCKVKTYGTINFNLTSENFMLDE